MTDSEGEEETRERIFFKNEDFEINPELTEGRLNGNEKQSTENEVPKKKSRNRFSFEMKAVILKEAKNVSPRFICEKYCINERTLRGWKRKQDEIERTSQRTTFKNFKKQPNTEKLDDEVFSFVLEAQKKGVHLTNNIIKQKARKINKLMGGNDSFKASEGWLAKWKIRRGLRKRKEKDCDTEMPSKGQESHQNWPSHEQLTPYNKSLGLLPPIFTPQQEEHLKNVLLHLDRRTFGLHPIEMRRIIFQFAQANNIPHPFSKDSETADNDWFLAFRNKYPELALLEKTSPALTCGIDMTNVETFFQLLLQLISKFTFPPSRIFNADEVGIRTTIPKKPRVEDNQESEETEEIVTSLVCCNAAGDFIPPTLIIPRRNRITELEIACPAKTLIVCHPTGWLQTETFCLSWFQHFVKYAKPTEDDPVLLILDGLASYVKDLNFLETAEKAHVHILCVPPHTSHKLQPLDLCFIVPFKTYYGEETTTWLQMHPGQAIRMRNIGEIFKNSYIRAAASSITVNAFKESGICPYNSDIFHETFGHFLCPDTDAGFQQFATPKIEQNESTNVSC